MILPKIKMIGIAVVLGIAIFAGIKIKSWAIKVNDYDRQSRELNTVRDSLNYSIRTIDLLHSQLDTANIKIIDLKGNLKVYTDNAGSYQFVSKQLRDSTTKYRMLYFQCSMLHDENKPKKKRGLFN